jgi:hypothetical protein
VVDEYLDRVWEQTAGNGFQGAGLGAYDQEHSLDLAGLAVLVALRASSTDELKMIC